MGSDKSKFETINKIDPNEWKPVGSENGAEIVKSNRGYGEGEIRFISLDPKRTVDEEMQIYNYRKNQNNGLVSCYGVQANKAQNSTMCGNQQTLKVLTERIPHQWNELPQLSFPESLYALNESLLGFADLQSKAGSFQISKEMIGINNQNQIKVWLNENYAQNHPKSQRPFLQTTSKMENVHASASERGMVRTLINIVEEKCESGAFPPSFRERIHRSSVSFQDALNQIDTFRKQNNLEAVENINHNWMMVKMKSTPEFGHHKYDSTERRPEKLMSHEKVSNIYPPDGFYPPSSRPLNQEPQSPKTVHQPRFMHVESMNSFNRHHSPYTQRMTSPRGSKVTFNYRGPERRS